MGANVSSEQDVFEDAPASPEGASVVKTPGGTSVPKSKLYRHMSVAGRWELADAGVTWTFVQGPDADDDDEDEDEDNGDKEEEFYEDGAGDEDWYLLVKGHDDKRWARVHINEGHTFQFNDDGLRFTFHSIDKGPLAIKFGTAAEYQTFAQEFQRCKFENVHKVEFSEKNMEKALGKDFVAWYNGEDGDEVMWDAGDSFEEEEKKKKQDAAATPKKEYNEAFSVKRSPLGLAMGAFENSFMLHEGGIDVFRNERQGLQSRGTTVNLKGAAGTSTPHKGLLIKGETGMLLMSPNQGDLLHSAGLRQVDLEQEKVVAQWKFEKDGVGINMRDVTGDAKGAQLDPNLSTFLGLDDNRLCRWDMRDKHGVVQDLTSAALHWDEGHQFSRGTNFQCFATTGDGCVAVGSRDGRVRLYSPTSMRQAKTSFPGLGAPITHIDVTYDGHWVLATTNKFLFLINTMWRDEKGQEKSGFTARGGSHLAAPRLLKVKPEHLEQAGPGYKFQNAGFSWVTERGKGERHIVATVKQFSIIWNFRHVRSDHSCYHATGMKTCTCYTVSQRDESVVDSKFMHDKYMDVEDEDDAPLIIATPHKISSLHIGN